MKKTILFFVVITIIWAYLGYVSNWFTYMNGKVNTDFTVFVYFFIALTYTIPYQLSWSKRRARREINRGKVISFTTDPDEEDLKAS